MPKHQLAQMVLAGPLLEIHEHGLTRDFESAERVLEETERNHPGDGWGLWCCAEDRGAAPHANRKDDGPSDQEYDVDEHRQLIEAKAGLVN